MTWLQEWQMLFIKAVGLHSPCCFVVFHFSLQNQAELAFKLYTVFICTPNAYENITLCQASKWRLAALNSTFTVQLDLCYLMSLYVLHLCPGSQSAISFLLTGKGSLHVLCYFLHTCPKATDPQWHLCVLFIISVLGLLFKTGGFLCRDWSQTLSLQRKPSSAMWEMELCTAWFIRFLQAVLVPQQWARLSKCSLPWWRAAEMSHGK